MSETGIVRTNKKHYKDIADAIRSKKGTLSKYKPNDMAGEIETISEKKPINFYDYDGTVLYSYGLDELPLTELPAPPDHSDNEVPLTFQEWNHTLESVNSTLIAKDIGATYIPTDGKTHLLIEISSPVSGAITLCITQSEENGTIVDWGDGSEPEIIPETGFVIVPHVYLFAEAYDISIESTSGNFYLGDEGSEYAIFGNYYESPMYTLHLLKKMYIGSGFVKLTENVAVSYHDFALITFPLVELIIGSNSFSSTGIKFISFPSTLHTLAPYPFGGGGLATIILPEGITELKSLGNNKKLDHIILPSSVISVSDSVFSDSPLLQQAVFTGNVDALGKSVFDGCSGLSSIKLPTGLTKIEERLFSGCEKLLSITIPEGVTYIEVSAFSYSGLASMVLPSTLQGIYRGAFEACKFSQITLPDTTLYIGPEVFQNNQELTSIYLANVEEIGERAFYYCTKLAEIHIPASTQSIGDNAFGSSGIVEYYFEGATPPSISSETFGDIAEVAKFYVPAESVETYKTAENWSDHADRIFPMPEPWLV